MKKMILIMSLMMSSAFASETVEKRDVNTETPDFLKGATVIVRLANGQEVKMPADKFKVVPRKQQFVTTKVEKQIVVEHVINKPKKNRVSGLLGYGPQNGLNSSLSNNKISVESNVGFVGGGQYQRMLNDTLSVGVQIQTNKTTSALVGFDF